MDVSYGTNLEEPIMFEISNKETKEAQIYSKERNFQGKQDEIFGKSKEQMCNLKKNRNEEPSSKMEERSMQRIFNYI